MGMQPVADIQTNPATNTELTQRVIQLEAELAELQAIVHKFLHPYIDLNHVNGTNGVHSQLNELSGDDLADALVPIRILTDSDIRERLDELEAQYGMTSEEFYKLWQKGEADHIPEKMGWSMLFEEWIQAQQYDKESED